MNSKKLRTVLRFDMWASATTVGFTIVGASLLAGWLGVSTWVPFAVGMVLIPWVYTLWLTVSRRPLRSAEVGMVVVGNIGWAVIAAIVLVGYPAALSTSGKWIFGLFSLAVLDLGIAEWFGWRNLRPSRRRVGDGSAPQASEG